KDNGLVRYNKDIEEYIGKDYEVTGEGYFLPLENSPGEDFITLAIFDLEYSRKFENTKAEIIDIHGITDETRLLNWFYVEMEDGQKGLIYFWIGD
ncbi:MAG: hypothetical protein GX995_06760, partial [Clostridiales bacterium]|nr:hypothetical protein [Clostridiales bacterium]